MDNDLEKECRLCEYAEKISCEELYMCCKKGVVEPTFACRHFVLDPLKIEVHVRKLPTFHIPPFKV